MRMIVQTVLVSAATALALSGCQQSTDRTAAPTAEAPQPAWPASLPVVGDGVTLVSIPNAVAKPGDGDGQGDAKVAGTDYNATAQIRCSGYKGSAAAMCDAGVVRGTGTGTYIDVTLPGGGKRTIFFNDDGSFLSFSTAEADGTSAMETGSSRQDDTTIATLGTERYEIPDVLVRGD